MILGPLSRYLEKSKITLAGVAQWTEQQWMEGLPVWFPVRAHVEVTGQSLVGDWGHMKGN